MVYSYILLGKQRKRTWRLGLATIPLEDWSLPPLFLGTTARFRTTVLSVSLLPVVASCTVVN